MTGQDDYLERVGVGSPKFAGMKFIAGSIKPLRFMAHSLGNKIMWGHGKFAF